MLRFLLETLSTLWIESQTEVITVKIIRFYTKVHVATEYERLCLLLLYLLNIYIYHCYRKAKYVCFRSGGSSLRVVRLRGG